MLAIVDYGMGNLRSVQKAFATVGAAASIVQSPEQLKRADQLVLPGVGAFGDAMRILRQTGLAEALVDFVRTGRPFLGICLGLQLLFDTGFEDGRQSGLGVIAGECIRLSVDDPPLCLKVPHMGWNALKFQKHSRLWQGLTPGCHTYFVHSYHVKPADAAVVAATTEYGISIVAAIEKDNIVATQFHPEKSQTVGRIILKNFANIR
ncbi:MAG: imidazole glycerol phosphate synthase subunit HisH [Phycisphaerales bacterium]|nr:imidazole glycerol phosphate synthase subunit HisH [Phycisphaerales bacterium]